ncbi:MAG: SIR2 family protein [Actinobacteria bacterium]|nr:SIR2 family protein [Actinomycetota bacterium]MCL5069881.1 SIR2 family protein [Actinomycetota bacterium]
MEIDKCGKCSFHSSLNCTPDCDEKYNFCQDDYLKIPQYFYNKKKADYLNTIKEVFSIDAKPNKINSMIMDLQPKHIITTNFDKLIENTENPNKMIYKIVIKDEDLLTYHSNNSYIIKMHGDINELNDIVLKEEDYLNYSQKHILIETFIKSLLVDHTFLFIGYSLKDYNLKLIISWLEYLAQSCNKAKRQSNFILIERKEKYIDRYFSKNNIITISALEIPKIIKKRYSNIMPNKMGIVICSLLECISDTGSDYLLEPLLNILYERYRVFKDRKRISYEELKQYHSFKSLKRKGSEINLSDKSEFDSLEEILKNKSKKAEFIKKILLKAGIETISNESSSIKVEVSDYKDSYSELLKLDQQNRYKDVLSKVSAAGDMLLVLVETVL